MSKPQKIDRREMIKVAAGSAVLAVWAPTAPAAPQHHTAAAVGAAKASPWQPKFFTAEQNELVTTLAELILPATDTPGAREARVNEYIDLVLSDETPKIQKDFLDGLAWMNRSSSELYQKDFLALNGEQQVAILTRLSDGKNIRPEDQDGRRFFLNIRRRTVFGYYTSKIGIHQELEYKGKQPLAEWVGCPHPGHHGSES